MQNQRFQVDLSGILKVLSDSLYSSYQVFVRELLQNAMDAIQARTALEDFSPSIHISYVEEAGQRHLIFEDNGIGLTFEEIDEFLSKIGSSSKSQKGINRDSFIGQFGIGLLSSFMVSDQVSIITKSVKDQSSSKWVGEINGTYRKEAIQSDIQIGTQVFLNLKKEVYFDLKLLKELLQLYGAHLRIPIQLEYNGQSLNDIQQSFPWENGANILSYGRALFKINFTDYIPLKTIDGKTKGIAYILPHQTHQAAAAGHTIYIKDMFISKNAQKVLPEWAFFLKAVVNSSSLSPTASREDIYINSAVFELQKEFGYQIKSYLHQLSTAAPEQLRKILFTHNEALKSLALKDDQFFDFIVQWFVFPSSLGPISLKDIQSHKKVLYVPNLDQYRQILPIAKANDQLLVNAGYIYDHSLFQKLSSRDHSKIYQAVDAAYFGNILNDLDWELKSKMQKRLLELSYHLIDFNCELDLKEFEPTSVAALLHMSKELVEERDFKEIREDTDHKWGSVMDAVYSFNQSPKAKLFLNYQNLLIQKLLEQKASDSDQLFVEMIYVNALMLGHYPLQKKELDILNNGLLDLLNKAI